MQSEITRLISETVVAVFQANGRMLEWGDTFTAPFGLTSARWQILGAIAWARQKPTAPQIAGQMGISRQGAQKQLNLLVNDGLIEKLANPAHRRSPVYRLSAAGRVLFERVSASWESHTKAIGERFSASNLETTLCVLNELVNLHAQPAQEIDDEK